MQASSNSTWHLLSRHYIKPQRFYRRQIVIAGCGDVGIKLLSKYSNQRQRVICLTATERHHGAIRKQGGSPIISNLDNRNRVNRIWPTKHSTIFYLVPPSADSQKDRRSLRFLTQQMLTRSTPCVYVSTTGVFGSYPSSIYVDETKPLRAQTERAIRRVGAERLWRKLNSASILRVPGIYAPPTRLPIRRIQDRLPTIVSGDDSYTNHIHEDDLAHIIWLAAFRAKRSRAYIVCDHSDIKMGDYMDQVADYLNVPRPPRLLRDTVKNALSPMQWSFLAESRRLSNTRMFSELKPRLKYPTTASALIGR